MERGAFALLDVLGFKGIWDRYVPTDVINKLSRLAVELDAACAKEESQLCMLRPGAFKPQVRLLSDTIAISVVANPSIGLADDTAETYSVGILCLLVSQAIDSFLLGAPHLLLRGCITYGEHLARESFLIGPAVDEAAEYEKIANGAFVWLRPTAEILRKKFVKRTQTVSFDDASSNRVAETLNIPEEKVLLAKTILSQIELPPFVIEDYRMPIKGGERLLAPVFNPLAMHPPSEWAEMRRLVEGEMQLPRVDVQIKQLHTCDFLDAAISRGLEYQTRLNTILENSARGG